ncbi:flagellar hook-length control protein FliK [Trichococcus pasteurii]|uniref:Flagellar hook-length control protein flik n=1 Tax=Trichococcus pasteurii TaxID=43064 RepID=A0A1W1IIM3_9LACT|nr:flagellar hook-length control protein FliK [Trichococcus pasteurii]SFE78407.1 hook-length control protein FliK [Trichococcus pasteurii]SLM52850.1 flagellar hook-length control protein flik [Trichococcus pasteurii]SSB93731.1 flagellar hook-length control protein flik [Trichococcus pasteurii]
MIPGASSGISAQVLNPAQSSATKADGLIFDSVLSGMIKGKEPATSTQDEPTVSPEMKDSEESADQEATEQGYLNLFPYRILQDGKDTVSVRNVPTEEKADQTGTWLVSVAEKQQVITDKLGYSAPAVETPTRSEEIEAKPHLGSLPLSDAAITSTSGASGSQADEQTSIPESIGIREHGEKERYPAKVDTRSQQADYSLADPEIPLEKKSGNSLISDDQVPADDLLKDTATMPWAYKMRQPERTFPLQESSPTDDSLTNFPDKSAKVDADPYPDLQLGEQSTELQIKETTIRQPIADEEENIDQPEAAGKTPNLNENKAPLNQGPITRELATENVFGHKPSKVTASHIEDIQKTIEMQIEKTTVSGNTVVKILLTPDNIGDIHVQLIKTKDSITAVLHVQDTETKGLLEDQLPLLMEPFKHSIPDSPLSLTVVADASLAFSFSEGADPGQRKMERQESRKRTAKEKTETKQKPTTKQSSRGLSLLA